MNILQKKNITEIDDKIHKLIREITLPNSKIILLGSSSLKSQRYFSDYDFYCDVKIDTSKQVYEKFSHILDIIKSYPNCYFIELKLQTKDGSKKKIHNIKDFKLVDVERFMDNADFIKIDLIVYTDYEFIEVSVIYNFNNKIMTKEEYMKSLTDDIKDLEKDGEYYKILKRMFSLYKFNGNTKKLLQLSKIFNSPLGAEYKKASNLSTLSLLTDNYKDKETKAKVKINLKAIGEGPDIRIGKREKEIRKKLNDEAKKIYTHIQKDLNDKEAEQEMI